jgi:hypothetical protein
MCHKPITELSDEYREKAREIESMISQRLPIVTQAKVCEVSGADKNKINRLIANDLDLIATTIAVLGLKVVSEEAVFCSKETAEATRELLKNCFNSPDYMRILFK